MGTAASVAAFCISWGLGWGSVKKKEVKVDAEV